MIRHMKRIKMTRIESGVVAKAIPVIIPPWIIAAIINLFPHLVLIFVLIIQFASALVNIDIEHCRAA
jgi:hypothetical protein